MSQLSEDHVALPYQLARPVGCVLVFWTIYDHPTDYPNGFVLRASFVLRDGFIVKGSRRMLVSTTAWYASTPDELESILPDGVIKMGPQEGDDPVILSVWME
jgi:hypothetical protein